MVQRERFAGKQNVFLVEDGSERRHGCVGGADKPFCRVPEAIGLIDEDHRRGRLRAVVEPHVCQPRGGDTHHCLTRGTVWTDDGTALVSEVPGPSPKQATVASHWPPVGRW